MGGRGQWAGAFRQVFQESGVVLEDPQTFLERLQTIVAARDPKAVQELLVRTFPSYREAAEAQRKTQSS